MRRTKIVATIGPASRSPERLRELMLAGLDVVRLNFSHCTPDEARETVANVRRLSAELDRPVAVLQDLAGPKIRTGPLAGGQVELVAGRTITITTRRVPGSADCVSTTYPDLARDVKPGDRILLDDGTMELRATATTDEDVTAEVVFGGVLGQHKGMNLPGVRISSPALTSKDLADLKVGLDLSVDYIALSFVRRGDEMRRLRQAVAAHRADVPIIAKIEKPEALDDLDAILANSDGIMVARGDLGVELSVEQVPIVQKNLIARANRSGITVITATQMLESMRHNPRPTRAEASDVANAILDGTDAVMLSAETSVGEFPVRAVETMASIAGQVEASEPFARLIAEARLRAGTTFEDAAADAACHAAHTIDARAIVVFTMSGATARELAQRRPEKPVFALTPLQNTYQGLALAWGVRPFVMPSVTSVDEQLRSGEHVLLGHGVVQPGDVIVIVVGTSPVKGATDTIRIHRVPSHG